MNPDEMKAYECLSEILDICNKYEKPSSLIFLGEIEQACFNELKNLEKKIGSRMVSEQRIKR